MLTDDKYFRGWFRAGLFSLVIVAILGALMRYKIAFDFPVFQQKNLLHAHSHFAFGGWITHMLYTAVAGCLSGFLPAARQRRYHLLIALNLVLSFGMLFSFAWQGYGVVSITFSTLTIVIAVIFLFNYTADSQQFARLQLFPKWVRLGLLLNVIASAGPLYLAYMMATKNIQTDHYLASVYYYLHFQYNGWFFFGSMSLLAYKFSDKGPAFNDFFKIMSVTVFVSFLLSVLWMHLPTWLVVITAVAACIQLLAWLRFMKLLSPSWQVLQKKETPLWIKLFFYAAALAMTIKFLLQAISAIPHLSQLVFGFRPIVIAYLHLVLLGIYSSFLLGWLFSQVTEGISKAAEPGAYIFLSGVVLNEGLLAVQGIASFAYIPVPFVNELLVVVSLILLTGAGLMAFSLRSSAA